LPFDIEFGFADGVLNLLQIRPLVQRGALAAEATVSAVIPKPEAQQNVALTAALGTKAEPLPVAAKPVEEPPKRRRFFDFFKRK